MLWGIKVVDHWLEGTLRAARAISLSSLPNHALEEG